MTRRASSAALRGIVWRAVASALVVAVLAGPLLATEPPSQHDVEESLTCQCGCGLTVHSCNHINCSSAEPMKREIAERIARGESKEQILAAFAERYGEKVLSSPTFRGFNWLAWITPFAAVLLGGVALGLAIGRRVRRGGGPSRQPQAPETSDPGLRERLARELEAYDRER